MCCTHSSVYHGGPKACPMRDQLPLSINIATRRREPNTIRHRIPPHVVHSVSPCDYQTQLCCDASYTE